MSRHRHITFHETADPEADNALYDVEPSDVLACRPHDMTVHQLVEVLEQMQRHITHAYGRIDLLNEYLNNHFTVCHTDPANPF